LTSAPHNGFDGWMEDYGKFLFGPDLLAAPVLEPGARWRRVYLPRGRWIDLWRSARYVERSGGLRLGRSRALSSD
jgi:alpha-glucosidase (family GH31 glycosyl hydrolase)